MLLLNDIHPTVTIARLRNQIRVYVTSQRSSRSSSGEAAQKKPTKFRNTASRYIRRRGRELVVTYFVRGCRSTFAFWSSERCVSSVAHRRLVKGAIIHYNLQEGRQSCSTCKSVTVFHERCVFTYVSDSVPGGQTAATALESKGSPRHCLVKMLEIHTSDAAVSFV